MRNENTKTKYNSILQSNGQRIRIDYMTTYYILLNSGYEIEGKKEKYKFFKRIKNNYKYNIDDIYAYDRFPYHIKKRILSNAGKKCQKIYGHKIKNNNLNQKGGVPWNKGIKNSINGWCKGKNKNNDYRLKRLSVYRTGIGNPMYGKRHSEEHKNKKSNHMKKLIENGNFTPNIHNSRTHMKTEVGGKKFRSSWEAAFYTMFPYYNYEELRIKYTIDDKEKIYIVDFISHDDKIAIEIKPSTIKKDKKFLLKENALKEWCNNNDYEYKLLTEEFFINNWEKIDFSRIDEKSVKNLKKMRETYENKKYKKNRKAK